MADRDLSSGVLVYARMPVCARMPVDMPVYADGSAGPMIATRVAPIIQERIGRETVSIDQLCR